jgi:hypothetical protein
MFPGRKRSPSGSLAAGGDHMKLLHSTTIAYGASWTHQGRNGRGAPRSASQLLAASRTRVLPRAAPLRDPRPPAAHAARSSLTPVASQTILLRSQAASARGSGRQQQRADRARAALARKAAANSAALPPTARAALSGAPHQRPAGRRQRRARAQGPCATVGGSGRAASY